MQNNSGKFEVPAEMREMLDRGVSEARKGFENVMKVAGEAVGSVERKAGDAQSQVREMHQRTMSYTEQNVAAAFELAEKMVKATSIEDVMKLQTEYMTRQFATLRSQIQEAGQSVQAQSQAAAAEMMAETQKMQAKAKEVIEKGAAAVKSATESAGKSAPRGRKS